MWKITKAHGFDYHKEGRQLCDNKHCCGGKAKRHKHKLHGPTMHERRQAALHVKLLDLMSQPFWERTIRECL